MGEGEKKEEKKKKSSTHRITLPRRSVALEPERDGAVASEPRAQHTGTATSEGERGREGRRKRESRKRRKRGGREGVCSLAKVRYQLLKAGHTSGAGIPDRKGGRERERGRESLCGGRCGCRWSRWARLSSADPAAAGGRPMQPEAGRPQLDNPHLAEDTWPSEVS
ncbi:hypothetical protein EYF80_054825 [Liparis tanakae]|uniref:Uncharacterized protein n=1 Tax=Liparis tanakae TaxID=230148 RepID=A0A4Z2F231_9TELE|nr:hypothetical protein EYF80_054825 [Liparis tanakae]